MKTVIEMAREAGGMFDHMMWLNRDLLPVYERLVELARADERERWEDVKNYLTAARDGSMSRNNSEALAGELLEQLERDITPASVSPDNVVKRGFMNTLSVQDSQPFGHKHLTLTGLPSIFNARYREVGSQDWQVQFTGMHAQNGRLTIWAPEGKCLEFEFRCPEHEWERITIDARTTVQDVGLKRHGITRASASPHTPAALPPAQA